MGIIIDGILKTLHEAHKDLWNELSQNPGMEKGAYFRKHKVQINNNGDFVRNNCFACEYCGAYCKKCPIVLWRNDAKTGSNCCACAWSIEHGDSKDGLFSLWCGAMSSGNYDEACEIAKRISDLDWIEPDEPK